ncbi:hypothetical protein VNO77_22819 [Canavalia gladiata]|uniref:Uncharacterized protein n=1 Tax=Canavalia gladiata TaxID=3824 RepID=A0AAN9L5W3_CANGL
MIGATNPRESRCFGKDGTVVVGIDRHGAGANCQEENYLQLTIVARHCTHRRAHVLWASLASCSITTYKLAPNSDPKGVKPPWQRRYNLNRLSARMPFLHDPNYIQGPFSSKLRRRGVIRVLDDLPGRLAEASFLPRIFKKTFPYCGERKGLSNEWSFLFCLENSFW